MRQCFSFWKLARLKLRQKRTCVEEIRLPLLQFHRVLLVETATIACCGMPIGLLLLVDISYFMRELLRPDVTARRLAAARHLSSFTIKAVRLQTKQSLQCRYPCRVPLTRGSFLGGAPTDQLITCSSGMLLPCRKRLAAQRLEVHSRKKRPVLDWATG